MRVTNLSLGQGHAMKSPLRRNSYNGSMARVLPLIFIAAAAFGQIPPAGNAPAQAEQAPPPEVDAALRARASQFLQLETEGKYNQALQLIAEDTKDLYVGSSKPSIYSFEIKSIQYSDSFTKALVMSSVHRMMPIEGFMGHPVPMKMPTRWKIENGLWCYYVDPKLDMPSSPFGPIAGMANGRVPPGMPAAATPPPGIPVPGMLAPGIGMPVGNAPAGGRAVPPPLPANLPNPRDLSADKKVVKLKVSGPSEDKVVISNISPWAATLAMNDLRIEGLEAKLDRLPLQPGEKATLTVRSAGTKVYKNPITIFLTVKPTRQSIPITVTFEN